MKGLLFDDNSVQKLQPHLATKPSDWTTWRETIIINPVPLDKTIGETIAKFQPHWALVTINPAPLGETMAPAPLGTKPVQPHWAKPSTML